MSLEISTSMSEYTQSARVARKKSLSELPPCGGFSCVYFLPSPVPGSPQKVYPPSDILVVAVAPPSYWVYRAWFPFFSAGGG